MESRPARVHPLADGRNNGIDFEDHDSLPSTGTGRASSLLIRFRQTGPEALETR